MKEVEKRERSERGWKMGRNRNGRGGIKERGVKGGKERGRGGGEGEIEREGGSGG